MNKIKEFFKVKSHIAISAISLLAIVAIASVAVFMITKKPPTNEIVPTVAQSSEETSSETASSEPTVKVLDIVATSSTAPISSKETLELKVDGNPSSKVTESKPVEKPKASSSKPTEKPSKPTSTPPQTNTPADGDTKLENGNWYTYWSADGQWHYDAPEDGGKTVLDDGEDQICPICGGITNKNGSTCTCPPVGHMG